MEYVSLDWYACNCSGSDTVAKERLESYKKFLHDLHGAYKFVERDRNTGCVISISYM